MFLNVYEVHVTILLSFPHFTGFFYIKLEQNIYMQYLRHTLVNPHFSY